MSGKLRQKLLKLRRQTDAEFDKHIKAYNCRTDWSGCTDRPRFQARLELLNELLEWERESGKGVREDG